jgi:putative hydrolase of the HAD superfamily
VTAAFDGIVFDFGGVVVDGPFEAFTALEQHAGVPRGTVRAINSRNPDTNAWARIERGEIDLDTFVTLFEQEARELGTPLPAREILDVVVRSSAAPHHARQVMLELLRDLRTAGRALALITNNIRPLSGTDDAAWVFDAFDVVVESCRSGMRKPEQAIYRHTLDALGTAPERTVMLDDLGINLKPARALGMTTVKVLDAANAAREVRRLVGLDPATADRA